MNVLESRDITSSPPAETEHPKLYEVTALELGVIVVLVIIGIVALAIIGKNVDAVVTGLVAIGSMAAGGLVRLMEPRK